MKKITTVFSVLGATALFGLNPVALAAQDCDEGAERAYRLGQKADANNEQDDALRYYRNAAENCSRSEYWMAVGDILVTDFFGSLSADEILKNGGSAADAYVNAFKAAATDEQRFAAATGLTRLGVLSGDPLNARKWVGYASQLDPTSPTLEGLRADIQKQEAQGVSEVEIRRARGTAASLLYGSISLLEEAPPPAVMLEKPEARKEKVPLPVNFVSNSITPDAATASNIRSLANVLAEESSGASFIFVGHADQRGEEDYNLTLSERRAVAIRDSVISQNPELNGRIEIQGMGESDPLDLGSSREALRLNRRLDVWIVE